MDIYELDSYRLSDAVKFHTELNPALWEGDRMRPEVQEALLKIADDFREFLGIEDLAVEDITVSGSNAAYTYTPHSDIDLHLIVDFSKLNPDQVYQELFNAKKYQYNDQHDIKIRGYDVELYVQDAGKPVRSLGEYSIVKNDWNRIPVRRRGNLDEKSTKAKYEKLRDLIELALKSDDLQTVTNLTDVIKKYRQAGLDEHGEFGPENLAYKILRTQGLVKKLFDHRASLEDRKLSLAERKKKKKSKKKFRYGAFGGYYYPGYGYYGSDSSEGDGGGDGGGESVREQTEIKVRAKSIPIEKVVRRFVHFAAHHLKLDKLPRIILQGEKFSRHIHSMGHYVDDKKMIEVATHGRHIMDILRTVAHELTHYRQHERLGKDMPSTAGRTGSPYENEANAQAGIIMRHFQNRYPEFFGAETVEEQKLKEFTPSQSGATGEDDNIRAHYGDQTPPGPEFPPTMPAGTLRVDVSDVYDWYKIGQHISNLDGLGKHDFGKGPPSSIISFGDEETEHKFIDNIRATGLDVTDIDPRDPKKRPGGKIKTDPTYNVDENLKEFAPSPGYDDDWGSDVPRDLHHFANLWWNSADPDIQAYIEDQLATGGWSIAQVESENDAVQLQHQDGTTYYISADEFDPDLHEGLGKTLATGALAAAAALGQPAQAQDAGRIAYQIGKQIYQPSGIFTRAGAEEELKGIARDMARGSREIRVGGKLIYGGPRPQGERVASNASAGSPEEAYRQALENAISRAQSQYGPITLGQGGWKVTDYEADQIGNTYRAMVAIEGPAPRRESIQTPVNRSAKDQEDYYRFLRGKVANKRPLTRQEQEFLKTYHLKQQMGAKVAESLTEFAPPGSSDGDDGFSDDTLRRLAAQWYQGDEDPAVERTLAAAGWEIGQDEGYDDEPGVFVVQAGDINGNSYMSWPASELKNLTENASGYIPTKKQARDPRFKTALTVDIKPGQLGKEANKLGLQTDSQGRPALLMKNLANALKEYKETGVFEAVKPVTPIIPSRAPKTEYPPMVKQKTRVPQDKPSERPDGTGKIIDYEIKESFNVGDVIDLTPNYSAFKVLHGEIQGTGTDGKLRIKIVQAEPASKEVAPGTVIKVAPNYVRRSTVISESENLLEVKMSPSALEAWARSPEAEGIRAGFEAEMIFRDTKRDEDEGEMEPDYDYDERPDDIDHVVDFFSYDEYGYGLSSRGARDLREQLYNEYQEWVDEQISESWSESAEDQVRDYMETNVWGDDEEREKRIQDKIDELFPDDDVEAILAAGAGAPRFTRSSDQQEYINQNDLYAKYKEAEDAAYEEFEQEVASEYENRGDYYDQAREYHYDMMREDGDYDERDWLRSSYPYMSDIENSFSITWPYWTGGSSSGGSRDWNDIADSLERVVGMDVKVGSGYHSVSRRDNRYIIEPDGSLDPDDYEDAGLEIVSPPMPLPQALEQLQKVIEWGNNQADAYTNRSTGLHMGVSIPYVGGDVDYVKLVLFMGDEYVLEKFGRASNTYAESAMKKIRKNLASARQRGELKEAKFDPMGALELVQKNLIELAARSVQGGVGTSKYTSAHIKDGYIEFRSPGGDYLSMESRGEYDDIKNTMLRFARAMQIAGNPSLERKAYAKKLYKLISPGAQDDALKVFSEYAAGTLSSAELKKRWADAVLQKELPQKPAVEEYEVINPDLGQGPESVIGMVTGQDYNDAYQRYEAEYRSHPDWRKLDMRRKMPYWDVFGPDGELVKTIRSRDQYQAIEKARNDFEYFSDDWRVVQRPEAKEPEPEKKLSRRAQVAKRIKEPKRLDYNYDIIDRKTNQVVDRFYATSDSDATNVYDRWLKSKNLPTDTENYGYRPTAQAADNARDSQQLQARIGEPRPAGGVGSTGRYRVTWDERRDGELHSDSLNIDAPNATAAMDRVRDALQLQGRDIVQISADIQEPRQTSTSGTAAGEFTGQWRVLNRNGEEVYRFSGVGNSQSDANRTAQTWLISQGDDLENQGPFNVYPVMG